MTHQLNLRDKDKQLIISLIKKHLPDTNAWAYGSRVKGTSHSGSDLDLVLFKTNKSMLDFEKLSELKAELRESNIPIIVDIRDWERLPESFHKEILKDYYPLICETY
jgi:predicted nucleotidyltransferase